ncbi:hypothetical protein [Streptomyces sp. NPDC093676]|uniref:hypothetical protein n=1 Tax=Streptomyces sp. NPDC093676 TaxID=3366050 RepID=UPI0038292B3B
MVSEDWHNWGTENHVASRTRTSPRLPASPRITSGSRTTGLRHGPPSNPDSWGSEAASKRDDVEQTIRRLKPSTLPFPHDHGLPDQARETYSECAFISLSGRRDDGVVGMGGLDR